MDSVHLWMWFEARPQWRQSVCVTPKWTRGRLISGSEVTCQSYYQHNTSGTLATFSYVILCFYHSITFSFCLSFMLIFVSSFFHLLLCYSMFLSFYHSLFLSFLMFLLFLSFYHFLFLSFLMLFFVSSFYYLLLCYSLFLSFYHFLFLSFLMLFFVSSFYYLLLCYSLFLSFYHFLFLSFWSPPQHQLVKRRREAGLCVDAKLRARDHV